MNEHITKAMEMVQRGGRSQLDPGMFLEAFDRELIAQSAELVSEEHLLEFLKAVRTALRAHIRERRDRENYYPGTNKPLEDALDDLGEIIEQAEVVFHQSSIVNTNDDYLNANEVCKILGISPVTLWRWRKEGRIRSVGAGRRTRFAKRDVEKMMA